MSDATPKSGWGALLHGDSLDLQIWANELMEPFEPWVESHGDETVLRSASFGQSKSAAEVGDRAIVRIATANTLRSPNCVLVNQLPSAHSSALDEENAVVVTVDYRGFTPAGELRHPVIRGLASG